MSVVLIGTVESTYRVLETLISIHTPVSAVLSLSPGDAEGVSDYHDLRPLAQSAGIAHRYIQRVNSPDVVQYVAGLKPDVILIIGWSQLVRAEILAIPRYGCIGAHPALLPRNRGRAAIPWALIQDESATGMTLFYIDEGTDSGDIIDQRSLPVSESDTAQTIYDRAVDALCEMVGNHMADILEGSAPRRKQNTEEASYCAQRRPEDGLIDWCGTTRSIFNLVRGVSHPYPGAFTYLREAQCIVWSSSAGNEEWVGIPGQVVRVHPQNGALVKTGDGTLWVREIEVEGKTGPAGQVLRVGDRLGAPPVSVLLARLKTLENNMATREGRNK